ncbi:hypothetical protein PSPO01_08915 [Paraphaeosphaeria sporulosa]
MSPQGLNDFPEEIVIESIANIFRLALPFLYHHINDSSFADDPDIYRKLITALLFYLAKAKLVKSFGMHRLDELGEAP